MPPVFPCQPSYCSPHLFNDEKSETPPMMNKEIVFDNNRKEGIATILTAALETSNKGSTIDLYNNNGIILQTQIIIHLPPSEIPKLPLEIPKQPKLLQNNNIPDEGSCVLLPPSEGEEQARQPSHLLPTQHEQHQQSSLQLPTIPERRRVSFAPEVEYINILHKEDYTPTEYKATWYSVEECFLMRQGIEEILSNRWNKTETMRGLEPYTTSGMEDLRIVKQCCIYPVLIEQERQRRKHVHKPRRIAKIYKKEKLHNYSINKAIEIAKQDAKDAQDNSQQFDFIHKIRNLWVVQPVKKNETATTTTTTITEKQQQQIIRSSSSDDESFDNNNKCQFPFFDPSDWFPPSSPLMVVP